MQPKRFSKEFQVHYYEINKHQEATPLTLVNYLEDTAISHSSAAGLSVNELKAMGTGWILNRWSLVIDEYPVLGQKVVVETWPSHFERFYAWREFIIKNYDNKAICRASSLWIYLDIHKRRPVRIPADFGERYGIENIKAVDAPFTEFSCGPVSEPVKEFSVRRSDIDTNEHVNNTRYIEWLLEAVPQEIYDGSKIHSLEIVYKKETNYGKTVCSGYIAENSSANGICLLHSVWDKNSGLELAAAKTIWKK